MLRCRRHGHAGPADDLVRYHGKLLIVDREELYVLGFNYTAVDLKSRSFGIVTRDRRTVQEALRLFDADATRQEFEPELDGLVVSPENAREQLATFIKRAKKQLVIWDPKVDDPQMMRLLNQRAKAGVDIRILGKVGKRGGDLRVQKLTGRSAARARHGPRWRRRRSSAARACARSSSTGGARSA